MVWCFVVGSCLSGFGVYCCKLCWWLFLLLVCLRVVGIPERGVSRSPVFSLLVVVFVGRCFSFVPVSLFFGADSGASFCLQALSL